MLLVANRPHLRTYAYVLNPFGKTVQSKEGEGEITQDWEIKN